jgi:S1-C subfamily serine protease
MNDGMARYLGDEMRRAQIRVAIWSFISRWSKRAFNLFCVTCALILFVLAIGACTKADFPRGQVRKLMTENGSGSGVVIRPGLVLTARHVAIAKGLLITKEGAKGEGVILSEQEKVDLALIRYPLGESPCPCVALADSEAGIDEPVYVIGYPLGIAAMVTLGHSQGVIDVSVKDMWGNAHSLGRRLVLTAGVHPGNSGGGVFVYRNGQYQLVGILVEMLGRPGGPLSFAIPLSDIKDFLAGRA